MPRQYAGRPRGTIVPRGDGKWLLRASLGTDAAGQRVRVNKVVSGTKSEAQRQLTALLKSADDGQPAALTRQTVDEWLSEWVETWCKDITDRTRRDYADNVRRYVPRALRCKRLPAVTGADVQNLLNELAARGLAPRTVRYLHATLRRAFNVALRLGKITRNVVTLAAPPRQDRKEMRALDPCAARAFLRAAEGTRYEALWQLLLTCGLRPAEAFALRWGDLSGSRLSVQRSLVRTPGCGWALQEPKTARSRRVVALPSSAVRALQKHRAAQAREKLQLGAEYEDHGLMFASEAGAPLHHNNLSVRYFKPLLPKAGLPDLRLYDLRHSAATLRLANGENPKIVSEMLGHASIVLTLDTYSHVLPEMQAASAARLDALLYPPDRRSLEEHPSAEHGSAG